MAAPISSSSTAPSAASGPDPAVSSPQPLSRHFASSPLRPPPLFPPQPIIGKPLNPPPPPHPQGFVYHHRAFPPRPSSLTPQAAAVMTFAAVTQARPFVYGTGDQVVAQMHMPIHHVRTASAPSVHQPATPVSVPRPGVASTAPPKSATAGVQQKVSSIHSAASTPEKKTARERERSREEDVMVINDRKVRILEGRSPSLYALCRSWVRNGQPHEIQSNFGDAEKLLPRPLPASMIDPKAMKQLEDDTETEDSNEEEPVDSVEELSITDLLQRHVKHAKSVRARLRKERLRRIQRCKQRLALLLPPPSELGRNEITP